MGKMPEAIEKEVVNMGEIVKSKLMRFKKTWIYDLVWWNLEKITVPKMRKEFISTFKEFVDPELILDTCSGTGLNFPHLEKLYPTSDIYTIEIEPHKVEYSKRRATKINVSMGNVYDIDFPDNTFDVVINTEAITVVKNPGKAMDEMLRVAKEGGIVAIFSEWKVYASAKWYAKILYRIINLINDLTGLALTSDMRLDIDKIIREKKLDVIKSVDPIGGFFHARIIRK